MEKTEALIILRLFIFFPPYMIYLIVNSVPSHTFILYIKS